MKLVLTWGTAEFCLLEQILPDGPDHPFASTMTGHFEKLSTPIKSVTTYPTIPQQHARFRNRGWSKIRAQSLWSAWNDETFFSPDDRRKLDHIEPFDEWEVRALEYIYTLWTRCLGPRMLTRARLRSLLCSGAIMFSSMPGTTGMRTRIYRLAVPSLKPQRRKLRRATRSSRAVVLVDSAQP